MLGNMAYILGNMLYDVGHFAWASIALLANVVAKRHVVGRLQGTWLDC